MATKPYTQNAADSEQVTQAQEKERYNKRSDQGDLAKVLESPQGRRFVWRLLTLCGVFQSSFEDNYGATSFNEGRRSVGLRLLSEVTDLNPEHYVLMMQEAKKDV